MRPRHLAGAFAGLAAAAAIALVLAHPRPPRDGADLPAYAITAMGGQDAVRSAEAPSGIELAAAAGAPLTVDLRPPADVEGGVDVHVFAVRGGSAAEAHPRIRIAASGAIELRGTTSELAGSAPGDAAVVVVVARQGTSVDARAVAEGASPPRGVSVARVTVHVLP